MRPAPVAVSCGEPAGIGPEIAAMAWAELRSTLPFVFVGDPRHLPEGTPLAMIDDLSRVDLVCEDALPVLEHPFPGPAEPGHPNPDHADVVVAVIARAVALVRSGVASALCTMPISKQVLQAGAGFPHPGHTEYLAALAGTGPAVMMLAAPALRAVPATVHIPLAEVPGALTAEGLAHTIRVTHRALQTDFGVEAPRLAVAGLNPHAGEGGAMGREEIELIVPVLEALRAEGLALIGPLSADTMFHSAARAGYDAAIAMYHDQALIPLKTLDFAGGVNVTLGLPFVRTSPDHGTAFDLAGQGQADPTSAVAALRMAAELAARRTPLG